MCLAARKLLVSDLSWRMFKAHRFLKKLISTKIGFIDFYIRRRAVHEYLCFIREAHLSTAWFLQTTTTKHSWKLKLEDWFILYLYVFSCVLFKRFNGAKTDIWLHLGKISLQSTDKFFVESTQCPNSWLPSEITRLKHENGGKICLKIYLNLIHHFLMGKHQTLFVIRWTLYY